MSSVYLAKRPKKEKPKKVAPCPITLEKLNRQKGDFRAQLPQVDAVMIALDYGFLRERFPDEAVAIQKMAASAMLLGKYAFYEALPDGTLTATCEQLGLLEAVAQKLTEVGNREHYLRFILKHLRPDAFAACRQYYAELGEPVKVKLLDLAQPFLNHTEAERPIKWRDNKVCQDWMGGVVGHIERTLGGALRETLGEI